MKKILIGTNNPGKIKELKTKLTQTKIDFISPIDLGLNFDPAETGDSFEDNALDKAQAWAGQTKLPSLAEDSGLCINSLDGQPGIHSKRFFKGSDYDKNLYILKLLKNKTDRSAFYVCVMVFYDPSQNLSHLVVGECHGQISLKLAGTNGFGYDPIFIPQNYDQTFGQLSSKIKLKISHRAQALAKMLPFLQQWSKK